MRGIAKVLLATVLAVQLPVAAWSQTTVMHVAAPANEPQNLGLLKTKLKKYHDCCYAASLDRQSKVAIAWLEQRAAHKKPGEKLALVLDIDETSLSNYPEELEDDFGFIQKDWNAWAESEKAAAIPGTLRLEKRARELGIAVFFITGRADTLTDVTAKNLTDAGYVDWQGLTLRSQDQLHEATIAYKSAARADIVKQGYKIILNVGDQWSDLRGTPQAEFNVKLPNPFYYIP
jgi:acid phosphatase